MKRIIAGFIIFLTIFVSADAIFGYFCKYMESRAKTGGTASRLYLIQKSNEDIVMFGSSRMSHHYDPTIFEDSLDLSCYNAGEDGYGILNNYGMILLSIKHHKPKMIIYDVCDYDIKAFDPIQQTEMLRAYYDVPEINEIFKELLPKEYIKLKSNMYRYNSKFFRLLSCYIGYGSKRESGYLPMDGTIDYDAELWYDTIPPLTDPIKMRYFARLIDTCKANDVQLVFSLSPSYMAPNSNAFFAIKKLCEEKNVPIYDYYSDSILSINKRYFRDKDHMNSVGASIFTKELVNRIVSDDLLGL